MSRLDPGNPATTDGVLKVAHSIFKRWRPLIPTDELYTEINHVLDRFTEPFLRLISSTDVAITQNESNKTLLEQHLDVLNTSIKVLHDLTCQEIPDAILPHLEGIVGVLDKYLKFEDKHALGGDDVGVVEYIRAAIFGLLTLWLAKNEEDIRKYVGSLVASAWNLLTSLNQDTKYDILASRDMNFLTSVASSPQHSQTFKNEETLRQIIEKVILPNIALREVDEELFEDEPIEYIRKDLEGGDNDTRRRAATDFLRRLMESFQQIVTTVTMEHIQRCLQTYGADRKRAWKSKDTAVYLFCSIAAVGLVTQASGVQSTNQHVDVLKFFQEHIAEDLTSDPAHAILQVDAIKFLYTFRKQLTQEQWQQALPMVVRHLVSSNYVVHTYAAITIERTLFLVDDSKQPKVPRTTITPLSKDILTQLFKLISASAAPEKVQENEFLIRCVMRVLVVIREDLVPLTDFLITSFTNIMRVIRHNPSNPRFYYYLFESVGALIRFAAPSQPEKLENSLYDPLSTIIREAVQEFIPYVFQLFAALLEARSSAELPDYYKDLIQPILSAQLWETRGNTPALTRLLCALISRGSDHILAHRQLEPVLGLFQRLISSKSSESYGFDTLETLVLHLPAASLQPYWPTIFQLLFARLTTSRTDPFALRFTRLYHLMSLRNAPTQALGADAVCAIAENVQAGLFTDLYLHVVLPESQKLTRPLDRKVALVSFTKTLADSRAFADRYAKGWGHTAKALLALVTSAPALDRGGEDIVEQDAEDVGFGVGFTALSTVRRPPVDPCPDVTDVRAFVRAYLTEAAARDARVAGFVQERLDAETREGFAALLAG